MAAFNNIITLTVTDSISGFTGTMRLGSAQIVVMRASGSGSVIYYNENAAELKWVVATQTPAALSILAQNTIPVTITSVNGVTISSTTYYLNANLIVKVTLDPVTGTGSVIEYFNPQTSVNDVYVATETPAAIQTAVAAIISSGGGSVTTGLTAHAGGGQSLATQLSFGYNEVTIVATAGDSVKLQPAQAGATTTVLNDGANAMDVYPATGDKIDDGTINVAISLAPGNQMTFTAIDATNWETSTQTITTSTLAVSTIKEKVAGQGTAITNKFIYADLNVYSNATGITAFAGGGQGSATALTKEYNNVTTVATAADSVKLVSLTGQAGAVQVIKNNGVANLAVFPASGQTIDGGAANASITMAPGTTRIFFGTTATNWESSQAVVVNGTVFTSTTGITAFATGGQASAVALTTYFNNITTCATAGDSVKLLTASAGTIQVVTNSGAASADVFPNTSDTINGGAADAAIKLPAGATMIFTAIDSTDWKSNTVRLATGKGTAALPSHTFYEQPDMGAYWISSTQQGQSVGGALVGGWNGTGLFTDIISEQTATNGVAVDGVLHKDGGVSNTGATIFANFTPMLIPDDIPAGSGGVIPVNNFFTTVNVDADNDAYTLADATQIGQLKKIFLLTTGGGNAVITPTSLIGGTTVTITAANGYVVLKWSGAGWACIEMISATIA